MDAMVLNSEEDDLMAYDGSDEDESDETSENGDQMDVEMSFQNSKIRADGSEVRDAV